MNESEVMKMERARTGNYGEDIPEHKTRYCPVCGEESPDYIYTDKFGDILGCSECIRQKDTYFDFTDEEWEGA